MKKHYIFYYNKQGLARTLFLDNRLSIENMIKKGHELALIWGDFTKFEITQNISGMEESITGFIDLQVVNMYYVNFYDADGFRALTHYLENGLSYDEQIERAKEIASNYKELNISSFEIIKEGAFTL